MAHTQSSIFRSTTTLRALRDTQPKKYLSQWRIEELKTALEDLGLDTTGNRPDLYKRLKDALGKGPSQSQTPNPSVHDVQELLKFNQGQYFHEYQKQPDIQQVLLSEKPYKT